MSLRMIAVYITLPPLALLIFRKPFFGLVPLAVFYSVRPDFWGAEYFRPAFILTVITLLALFLNQKGEYRKRLHPPLLIFILLSAWMLVNSYNAVVSSTVAWQFSVRFAKLMVMYFVVSSLANSPRRIRIVLWSLIIGLLWLSKTVFVQYLIEGRLRADPLGGGAAGGNAMATDLCMTLPFLLYLLFYEKGWLRILSGMLIVVWLFDFVAIGSRGGFLGLLLVGILFFLKSEYKVKIAAGMVPIIIVFLVLAPQSFWERMETTIHYQEDSSAMNRFDLWKIGLVIHRDYPLFGIGTKNFQRLIKHYDSSGNLPDNGLVAHNSYIELLAENGYPGLLLYLLGIAVTLFMLRKARKTLDREADRELINLSHALEIAIIVFLLRGLTGSNYMGDVLYWFLGLTFCLYQYILVRDEQPGLDKMVRNKPPVPHYFHSAANTDNC